MSYSSDEEIDVQELIGSPGSSLNGSAGAPEDGRRAHHNALERKRRDHIKDSFISMKQCVPSLKGERASRALILKKACDYIEGMKKQIVSNDKDIEQIKSQNSQLEAQIQAFETANRVLEQCTQSKSGEPSICRESVGVDPREQGFPISSLTAEPVPVSTASTSSHVSDVASSSSKQKTDLCRAAQPQSGVTLDETVSQRPENSPNRTENFVQSPIVVSVTSDGEMINLDDCNERKCVDDRAPANKKIRID